LVLVVLNLCSAATLLVLTLSELCQL